MIQCEICSEEFSAKGESARRKSLRLFCSQSCAARLTNYTTPRRNTARRHTLEKTPEGFYRNCFTCEKGLPLDRNRVFCSSKCREDFLAVIDSPSRSSDLDLTEKCKTCSGRISKRNATGYCHACGILSRREARVKAWLSGEWSGATESDPYVLSSVIRKYLLEKANYECSQCGYSRRHPDGSCILQINHIDGHANNHAPENLEVLCPNCHALTENHGGRNAGNGRPYRWRMKPAEPISV